MKREVMARGGSYPDKEACKKWIAAIKKNAPIAETVDETAKKEAVKKPAAKAKTTAKRGEGQRQSKRLFLNQ